MINELDLKPNELLVYALIHGFSQDGKSAFTGGIKYIMEWTKLTKQTCISILKTLREKKYIGRRAVYDEKSGNFLGYGYFTLRAKKKKPEKVEKSQKTKADDETDMGSQDFLPRPKNLTTPPNEGQNSLPAESKILTPAGQNFLPNNDTEIPKDIATACPEIKKLADKHFGVNAFDENFPAKTAAFLAQNGIENPDKYFEFIREKVLEKEKTSEIPIRSPRSFAYKLIFQVDIAQEFLNREEKLRIEEEEAEAERIRIENRKIPCPCCGERFITDFKSSCPKCDFAVEKFQDENEVGIYKRFLEMPAPRQEKYKTELEGIYFSGDFLKFIGMSQEERDLETKRKENLKAALDKKYGLSA